MNAPAIFVIGPTASGKSSLAMSIAERWPVEIISMDSAQIYRGMDVGTAKPEPAQRAAVPHHLLDIRDPAQAYSAAEFAADARMLIEQIWRRERLPLIVGGTFLYMRALLQGLHDMPAADPALRVQIEQDAARDGWPALHEQLKLLDPEAAAMIHPNDAQRIQRALEIVRLSGQARSATWRQVREPAWAGPVLKLAIVPEDRQHLRAQIAARFQEMMAQGFLQEVRELHARADLRVTLPSMRSVGYRQLWQHLDGEMDLDAAVERGIIATRQYAKRQLTWLRREQGLELLPQRVADRPEAAARILQAFLRSSGA